MGKWNEYRIPYNLRGFCGIMCFDGEKTILPQKNGSTKFKLLFLVKKQTPKLEKKYSPKVWTIV